MASWNDWVTGPNGLINDTNEIHRAAIYGQDGTCWAEDKLQCSKEEIMFVSNMFVTPQEARQVGFSLGGERYKYIREDTAEGGGGFGIVHARNGSCPVTLFRTNKAVVIGIGKPDAVTGKVSVAVCKIGDTLTGFNF